MKDLTNIFYKLIDNGYIYDEDEDGLAMSYSEYAEIMSYFYDEIVEELDNCTTIEDFIDRLNNLYNTADDDTIQFAGIPENAGGELYEPDDEDDKKKIYFDSYSLDLFNIWSKDHYIDLYDYKVREMTF